MNLRSRVDRIAVVIARRYGPGGGDDDDGDLVDDPSWMAAARAMGADHVRELAAAHLEWPEWRERLASTIVALDEWEATEPRWWLEGPWGQKRWRYGVRGRDQS